MSCHRAVQGFDQLRLLRGLWLVKEGPKIVHEYGYGWEPELPHTFRPAALPPKYRFVIFQPQVPRF